MLWSLPTIECATRRAVATALLDADNELLENTTLKIKRRCLAELHFAKDTGKLASGSQLHCILVMIARSIRLDAGLLQSLNSSIKSAMNMANNTRTSLELLSSRVNARKFVTMSTGGSTRLREVKPVLERLSKSSMIYQRQELPILQDTYRWAPPQPSPGQYFAGNPDIYEPCLKLDQKQRWAIKYNKKMMQALKQLQGYNAIGVVIHNKDGCSYFIVAEWTARLRELQSLDYHEADGGVFSIGVPIACVMSVNAIASVYEDVKGEKKKGLELGVMALSDYDCAGVQAPRHQAGHGRFFMLQDQAKVATMKFREYNRKEADDRSKPAVCGEDGVGALRDADDADGSADEADDDADDADIHLIARELCGDDGAGSECGLSDDEEVTKDLDAMQRMNDCFVATALERQQEQCHSPNANDANERQTDGYPDARPYEDEQGEHFLREFMNNFRSQSSSADDSATLPQPHASSCPPRQLSPDAVPAALGKWALNVCRSSTVCAEIAESCRHFEPSNVDACLGHELSLVLHEQTDSTLATSFATWLPPYRNLVGRSVRLDSDNCVVYPSHFTAKTHYSPCFMIMPAVGARVRKKQREQVRASALRARAMFDAAMDGRFAGSLEIDASLCCAACGLSQDELGPGHSLRRCAFCTLHWHSHCAMCLSQHIDDEYLTSQSVVRLGQLGLEPATMPFIFWLNSAKLELRQKQCVKQTCCCKCDVCAAVFGPKQFAKSHRQRCEVLFH